MSKKLAVIGRNDLAAFSHQVRHDRDPNEHSNEDRTSANRQPTSPDREVICGG